MPHQHTAPVRRLAAAAAALMAAATVSATVSASPSGAAPGDHPTHTFHWQSSQPVLEPEQAEGRTIDSVKDPSIVRHKGKYHVFYTIHDDAGWNLGYTSFKTWADAPRAELTFLDQVSDIGPGYRAAPQVFYFAPQKLWYLVYQTGNGSYSTTRNIEDPTSWSEPKHFYDDMPQIIKDNIGDGYWLDFWNVCDEKMCYLFSSDDRGHIYRSETTVKEFPNGYHNTVIAMEDPDQNRLFEATNVYRIDGSRSWILMQEAIGNDGRRWFRSWTAPSIRGPWAPLADQEDNPFARSNNVVFDGPRWSEDISHGEMVRSGKDQKLTIDPCARNQFLYQGMDPSAGGDYGKLPWRLGVITQDRKDALDTFCRPGPGGPGGPPMPGGPAS